VGSQVAIELGRRARVLVPHDPLDSRQVGAAHQQQGGRRMPEVVGSDLPDLPEIFLIELVGETHATGDPP
jgi:hypothetical protein